MGRLVKDPDQRQGQNTTVTKFTLAVDRRGEGTDFPSCVAFGKTAEFVGKYFKKGSKVLIEGRLQTGSYQKDGVTHYTTDIVVENAEFCESKKVDGEKKDDDGFMQIPEGVELPFE